MAKSQRQFPYLDSMTVHLSAETLNSLAQVMLRTESWDSAVSRIVKDWAKLNEIELLAAPSLIELIKRQQAELKKAATKGGSHAEKSE